MQLDPHGIGEESTGIIRRRGFEPSFDNIDAMQSGYDIIEEIRRESKKLRLKPREMVKEVDKLVVSFTKKEGEEADPESTANCCSICMVPFEEGDSTVPLPCNTDHVFHKSCILEWAQ